MRQAHADFLTELEADRLRLAWLVSVELATGTSYWWTGIGDFPWDGHTWTGIGQLGEVSPIRESVDLRAIGVLVSLAGVPTTLLGSVLGDVRQGLPASIWIALFDTTEDTPTLKGEPCGAFRGRVDTATITDTSEDLTITLSIESEMIALSRPNTRRLTNEQQQELYPGDLGLEYSDSNLDTPRVFAGTVHRGDYPW